MVTVQPVSQAVMEASQPRIMQDIENMGCLDVVRLNAVLTADSICCIPFCCCCGGCCGRYNALILREMNSDTSPGSDRCTTTCTIQLIAASLMSVTCCMCFWGCCGLASPCTKHLVGCVNSVENENENKKHQASSEMGTTPPAAVCATR